MSDMTNTSLHFSRVIQAGVPGGQTSCSLFSTKYPLQHILLSSVTNPELPRPSSTQSPCLYPATSSFKKNLCIYFAVPNLNCDVQDL